MYSSQFLKMKLASALKLLAALILACQGAYLFAVSDTWNVGADGGLRFYREATP
jgi:hypothetical protein